MELEGKLPSDDEGKIPSDQSTSSADSSAVLWRPGLYLVKDFHNLHKDNSLTEYMNVLARCRSVPSLPHFRGRHVTDCTKRTMQEGGVLAERRFDKSLDHTTVVVTRQKMQCALHRCVGLRKEGVLSYCAGCNVYLCSGCYHAFHTEKDSQKIKAEFVRQLENVSDDQREEHRITDESLRRKNKYLRIKGEMHRRRLDKKNVDHVPMKAKRNKRCAMHDWLGFEKTKEGRGKTGATLLYCPGCKVTLCRTCYNDFHKIPDLRNIKYWLQQECLERRDKPKDDFWLTMETHDYFCSDVGENREQHDAEKDVSRMREVRERTTKKIKRILSSP